MDIDPGGAHTLEGEGGQKVKHITCLGTHRNNYLSVMVGREGREVSAGRRFVYNRGRRSPC